MRILSLDDEPVQAELILDVLSSEGFDVRSVATGDQAIRFLEIEVVDLIVLDWKIPGISGLEVLSWIRTRFGRELPVLFVSNQGDEDHLVVALEAGADDYLVKPFRRRELIARVRALLRRAYPFNSTSTSIDVGRYRLDIATETAFLSGEPLKLTHREFSIAVELFRNFGRVVPRSSLIKSVWGHDRDEVSRSLDTHIYRMRSKLHITPESGVRLRALYNHGYRLEPTNSSDLLNDE
ncbi:response regulator transcription factor [Burkholderia sp. BCC0405]|uniref:response regulator transcription factor n=1 Tax=Burkholderia sp. BCC0405 TaxID=2676298 RepID=UPI00158E9995|nr:response regulator transcription factor [Burkholderia sp. BCC0405]